MAGDEEIGLKPGKRGQMQLLHQNAAVETSIFLNYFTFWVNKMAVH
jgi:hypothetical protein